MIIGYVYGITLGKYSDKYMCTAVDVSGSVLERVRMPKSKIDSVRLPQVLFISSFGQPIKTNNL